MPLRVMLDVNVLLSRLLSLRAGRADTSAVLLFDACLSKSCRLGALVPVASLDLLRTFRKVADRLGIPESEVEGMADAIEGSFVGGAGHGPLHAIVGGGVLPMVDAEDLGVMEAALASNVEFLITENLRDFTEPGRASLNCNRVADDVFVYSHPRLPDGMVISPKARAVQWLLRGVPPPTGLFSRFFPEGNQPAEPNMRGSAP